MKDLFANAVQRSGRMKHADGNLNNGVITSRIFLSRALAMLCSIVASHTWAFNFCSGK